MRVALLACLLISEAYGFAYSNYQIPARSSNRIRWLRSTDKPGTANCIPTHGTQNAGAARESCQSMDRVNPIWKHRPTYVQTFAPLRDLVLINFEQDDTQGNNGAESRQEWDTYTGIVAAVGPLVTNVKEGDRVYFSTNCVKKYTTGAATTSTVDWSTTGYSNEKAESYHGKLVNGISLNNGNGWGFTGAPVVDTNTVPANGYGNPSTTFEDAKSNTGPVDFGDTKWYPGRSGDSWWPRDAANNNVLREFSPPDNPNQQANYLLCRNSDIFGTVSQENFANLEGSHYVKPAAAFEVFRSMPGQAQ
eukprot:TRINITY_DN10332_c0_g1_i1.p1 TRINITY_DN10332_c0_g1~~TRINITY_DN10332_c0_g1_i1.p1  ORF type:complete len:305 (+),score=43.00 TRINITY_DN10332_c0_g1_i1:384-1298(+)